VFSDPDVFSRGKRIECVAARATKILPKLAGKYFASASSYSSLETQGQIVGAGGR